MSKLTANTSLQGTDFFASVRSYERIQFLVIVNDKNL